MIIIMSRIIQYKSYFPTISQRNSNFEIISWAIIQIITLWFIVYSYSLQYKTKAIYTESVVNIFITIKIIVNVLPQWYCIIQKRKNMKCKRRWSSIIRAWKSILWNYAIELCKHCTWKYLPNSDTRPNSWQVSYL